MNAAPEIETPRLRLRAHRAGDLGSCLTMWTEPAVFRFISGKPSTEQQTWLRILGYAGHWTLLGFGYWAVDEKATGEFVGEVGLADFRRDIEPTMRGVPEAGWAFVPSAHGKGFATEALGAALAWADVRLAGSRTVCTVAVDNLASIRVAQKCGYREFGRSSAMPKALYLERAPVRG